MPTSGTASPDLVAQAEPEPFDAYEGFEEDDDSGEDGNSDNIGTDEEEVDEMPDEPEPEPEPEPLQNLESETPEGQTEQMSDPNSFEGFSGGMGGAAY